MPLKVQTLSQRFAADERGTIAVLFGLMFMVLVLLTGIAVDQSRLFHSSSKVLAAADAAALAAARTMLDGRADDDEVKTVGLKFFNENVKSLNEFANIRGVQVVPNRAAGTVTVNVDAEVPMTITRVAGFNEVELPSGASTAFDRRDIELGMALDVTGSMGGRKIADLQAAAKDLLDILLRDDAGANKVRIGLAPYSASVRLGNTYAAAASNNTSTDGCVRERTGWAAFTDTAPGTGTFFTAGGSPRDIDPTEGTQGYDCPSAALRPLTSDKASLKTAIDGFRARGATAGHIGTQWAWNLISPEWRTVWPAASAPVAYGEPNTIKAIILMTDGIFNTAYVTDRSGNQALSLCSEMKRKDVVVYTVAFQSPAAAASLLRTCATSSDTFFNATDGDQLRIAFQSIAADLNNLRLTQ